MIDPGDVYFDQILEFLGDISIHEFMHIITPLNLHSQHIGNFNYADPVMSKHLWLYEGTTEYFSKLIKVRGGIISPKDFIFKTMRNKIRRAEKFPNKKMSFTEMSENVLKRKYKKQYRQVYERGAVISMLLDIEIIRLTDGAKTLIDVVMELAGKYGDSQSFDEDTFIDEFVRFVHPDLKEFFNKYVEGREELPYREILNVVGVEYKKEVEEQHPRHPVKDNKVKTRPFVIGNQRTIKKVGKKDFVGFRKGDMVSRNLFHDLYIDEHGDYIAENKVIEIPVFRDNEEILIPVKVEYMKGKIKNRLRILTDMTDQQERYYKIWLGID
jgi:predicted metalloprotease with PDZ domain